MSQALTRIKLGILVDKGRVGPYLPSIVLCTS